MAVIVLKSGSITKIFTSLKVFVSFLNFILLHTAIAWNLKIRIQILKNSTHRFNIMKPQLHNYFISVLKLFEFILFIVTY